MADFTTGLQWAETAVNCRCVDLLMITNRSPHPHNNEIHSKDNNDNGPIHRTDATKTQPKHNVIMKDINK